MSNQHQSLPHPRLLQFNRAQPSRKPRSRRHAGSAYDPRPIIAAVLLLGLVVACGNPTAGGSGPTLPEFEDKEPNDTFYQDDEGHDFWQWSLRVIDIARAWGTLFAEDVEQELGSDYPRSDVIIAVLDNQIDIDHSDLRSNLVDGYNARNNTIIDTSSLARPSNQQPGSREDHGTHVAGIVGAVANNDTTGIAGVGWNSLKIMPVTVLSDQGTGELADVINGLLFAAGMHDDAQPDRRADVINLSLGASNSVPLLESVIETIAHAGITVVAAAGNEGCDSPVVSPAAYASTIAVGSANPPEGSLAAKEAERAPYSNCGREVDLVAPGGIGTPGSNCSDLKDCILSTGESDEYVLMAGTSMAAPHVAGVAGLLYAVSDRMTPELVRRILTETAEPVAAAGSYPSEAYGWGMLNAGRAVRRALMDPYGPYRDDGSATTHYVWPVAPRALDSGARQLDLREEPEPGTYRPDHAILVLNEDWFDRTARADRRARLAQIAERHGLAEIRDRGHRFPTAILPEGKEVDRNLLEALEAEAEIESAGYDHYVRPL